MKKEYLTEDKEWFHFYPKFNSSFYLEKAAYFDERPQVHTSITQLLVLFTLPLLLTQSWWFLFLLPFIFFGWGTLYLHLPIRTGIQDCESAAWGFNYHGDTIWIYVGGGGNFEGGRKWLTAYVPWSYQWVRTSTFLKDGSWHNETSKNRKNWRGTELNSYDWLEKNKHKEDHSYTYVLRNGNIQNRIATVGISEREWRWHWFRWFSPLKKICKTIDINFNEEIGEEIGSWKGGCVGCSYNLLPNETPLECLRRMEKERKF